MHFLICELYNASGAALSTSTDCPCAIYDAWPSIAASHARDHLRKCRDDALPQISHSPVLNARSFQAELGKARHPDVLSLLLVAGLLTLPLMVVRVSILQPGHVWLLAALGIIVVTRAFRFTTAEVLAYLIFMYCAVTLTLLQDFPRVKQVDQIVKFAIFYPGFYVVGRSLGWHIRDKKLPIGYGFLFAFLAFQYVTQALSLPIIYQEISFGQGALHGTFLERNWLAFYFFLFSYVLLLRDTSKYRFIPFFVMNGLVVLLSGSKTTFIACGVIFLIRAKMPLLLKLIPLALGAMFYLTVLGDQFTQEALAVKMEEERGLALQASIELISGNMLGYGFGFVEAYFSSASLVIRGLGEGVNSVFAVPLDLMIIAGPAGLAFWWIFFTGIGNRAFRVLAPLAPLSLLNPLHQAELVYFFLGLLVSLQHWENQQSQRDHLMDRQRAKGFLTNQTSYRRGPL